MQFRRSAAERFTDLAHKLRSIEIGVTWEKFRKRRVRVPYKAREIYERSLQRSR